MSDNSVNQTNENSNFLINNNNNNNNEVNSNNLNKKNSLNENNMYEIDKIIKKNYPELGIETINKIKIESEYKHKFIYSSHENNTNNINNSINYNKDLNSEINETNFNNDNENNSLIPQSSQNNFDKIPLSILIFYSLPSFGKMSCFVLLNIHAMLYYESIGASLVYMSFFVTLARGIEIILKPFIAHISDELRTPIGRRKPFMLIGCGFYSLFLILLFTPPSMKTGTYNLSIWFGSFYVLFFIAETVTNVPYLALGPELSSNSQQRETLYFSFYVFQYIGVLFAASSPVLLNKIYSSSNCDCTMCYNNVLITDIDTCLRNCKIMCNLKANEMSLFTLSMSIGIFFVGSIILLSVKIKEKSDSFNTQKTSFLPSLYELITNKPFVSLIVPWVLDTSIMTIFSTMLPFFLNVIINPQRYCIENNISLEEIECSVNYYLGITISVFFICCILSCGFWHFLVNKFGKTKCWQTYSIICIVPFSLFLFCGTGTKNLLILSAILTAFPSGGCYLNDVLVSDTIDYDEFYTGKRNEGIFTVFSTFIPKFVSLFAQAIPLSIMALLGFVPSENGFVHKQPKIVVNFIKIFFSIVPICISLISFFFKLLYPIRNDNIMFKIKEGVDIQKEKIEYLKSEGDDYYEIIDPVYKTMHLNVIIEDDNIEKIQTKNLAEHFNNISDMNKIFNDDIIGIKRKVLGVIILSCVCFFLGLLTLLLTFDFLIDQKFSFIPISAVFVISFMLIVLIIYYMKYIEIKKAIEGKVKINKKFLKLLMYQKIQNDNKINEKVD